MNRMVAPTTGVTPSGRKTIPAMDANGCKGMSISISDCPSESTPFRFPSSEVTGSRALIRNEFAGLPGKRYAPSGPLVTVLTGVKPPSSTVNVTFAPATNPSPKLLIIFPSISPKACSSRVNSRICPSKSRVTLWVTPRPVTGLFVVSR